MDTKIYKVVPFSEVAVGQEFEDARYTLKVNANYWVKLSEHEMKFKGSSTVFDDGLTHFKRGCRLRIADCAPDDFDTWWNREAPELQAIMNNEHAMMIRELCRTAWDNGAFKASPESAL